MPSNEPETFFPELDGDQRRDADEWLRDYLRLIMRHDQALREQASSPRCPQDTA